MPVNLDDMLRQARLEVDATDQEIDATIREISEKQAHLERLREHRAGLRFTIEYAEKIGSKLAVPSDPTPPSAILPPDPAPWSSVIPAPGTQISQADLCELGVKSFERLEVNTTEVRERLQAAGHDLDQEKVRSSLAYLVRQKRIAKVSPGVWRLPSAADTPLPFVPLEPVMNGTGGVS